MKAWNSGKGRNIQKLTKSFLEEKINQGYSVNRIAKEVDCNRNSVYKKLAEFGLEVTRNQSIKSSRELMIEKFGGPSPFCSEKVRQKKAETLKKKYGVENISQVKEIKDKIKQTNLRRYGVENYLSTEDAQQKSKEKKVQKYGTSNLFSLKEIQEKSKETMIKKYGVDCNWKRSDVRKKSSENSVFKRKEIQEKIQNTLKEKYKTEEHPFKRQDVKEKIEKTNIESIGVKTPLLLEENKKKAREAFKKKYGVNSNFVRKEVRQKALKNSACKNPEIQRRNAEKFKEKYGYSNPFSSPEIQEKIRKTNLERYGVEFIVEREDVREKNANTKYSTSKKEKEILSYVKEIYKGEVKENDRKILDGIELDIYLPELNIAIEFNGAYWHSEQIKGKNYHKDKTKLCLDKGIRLIHIYEWEWDNQKEMIKTFLRFCLTEDSRRIYARKCEIRNVDRKTYHDYCRKNHLQGAKAGTKDLTVYGLYYNDELVQLMSFDKPSRSTKYQWEIIRGCPGSMNHVIGGNSKLFQHFIREKNPDNIMSKCDFDKFDGRGYYAMGMELVSWQDRCYDIWNEGGTLKATSYRPRRKENILKREQQMKNGVKLYSAGTGEFVWRKKDV